MSTDYRDMNKHSNHVITVNLTCIHNMKNYLTTNLQLIIEGKCSFNNLNFK
jgi:hypothetical protein